MASTDNVRSGAPAAPFALAELLDRIRERLETVESLAAEMQEALHRADPAAIDDATSRLETVALEFRLLHAEHQRLCKIARVATDAVVDPAVSKAYEKLHAVALRVARSSAIGGGLLERLIALTRGMCSAWSAGRGDSYMASGQARGPHVKGLRLKESV